MEHFSNKGGCSACVAMHFDRPSDEKYFDIVYMLNSLFLAGKEDDYALCNVSKSLIIHQLPKVLVLHIKRFHLEPVVRKDDDYVSFTKVLDMAPYCTTDCIEVPNHIPMTRNFKE